ncbi:MAG TPA: hypothetical protein VMZ51_06490 [Acidimicrobiales bacterium]|nr:hypothetical protein [Acidimicrobiales bacterium]
MPDDPPKRTAAWRAAVARTPRREATEGEFMDPLPRDENWIAELGAEVGEGGPAAAGEARPTPVVWLAVEEALREQRELIDALQVRVEALEKSLAGRSRGASAASLVRSMPGAVRWLIGRHGR